MKQCAFWRHQQQPACNVARLRSNRDSILQENNLIRQSRRQNVNAATNFRQQVQCDHQRTCCTRCQLRAPPITAFDQRLVAAGAGSLVAAVSPAGAVTGSTSSSSILAVMMPQPELTRTLDAEPVANKQSQAATTDPRPAELQCC